jgi:hypothetical protein
MPGHVLTPYVDATLRGTVSVNNTTTTPLGAGGAFTGTADDTLNFAGIIVSVKADQPSATNGMEVQFSPDNVNWFTSDTFTIPANTCKTFSFQPVGRYMRLKYTNGATPQAAFFMCLQFRQTSVKASSHRVEEAISSEDDSELVKAVLTGRFQSGAFDNVKLAAGNSLLVGIGDTPNLDAFSRLRVSDPNAVIESTFQNDLAPLIFNQIVTAGGTVTHAPVRASAVLAVAAGGDAARLQSKQYYRYLPGKSQLVIMTGVLGSATADVLKRCGYFDTSNGIFFEQNGITDIAWVRRSTATGVTTDNRVPQSSWNIDKLDGSGGTGNPSGLTLNLANAQIFVIDLQWLGMGRVRVGFDINGTIYYVHQFLNANVLTLPYMQTANLPVRWEISSTGGADDMDATCMVVTSEGGNEPNAGFVFSADNGISLRTFSAGTPLPVIAVRPRTTFNGLTNRIAMEMEDFNFMPIAGAGAYKWALLYDTSVTGGAWVNVNATNSVAEYNVTGTAVVGGIQIASGYDNASATTRIPANAVTKGVRYPWCYDGAGNQITIALVFTEVASNTDIYASMRWREDRS